MIRPSPTRILRPASGPILTFAYRWDNRSANVRIEWATANF
ncbi:hypothetical protein CEV33_4075 [Brucella grignonensis]|uniref:Uncharacterized protein n=1 Tax=Brucella grignonensis TaxID=94627 RepID=A0A256FQD1_9HYPH|nr:hypothetical protein CEV33_4075 [Brucella grignonensis]